MAKSIGIVSLKGGVGKTSSVVSLGSALAELGRKVLLVDANLSAPNLGLHLNIINPEKTLHHVLDRIANITEAIHHFGNFDVLPSSVSYPNEVSPFKIKDKIGNVKKDYDNIVIDSSPALNDETLGAMLASDEILVVTTPDYPTLSSTIKAVHFAKKRGTPISGLIVNKVHHKSFEIPINEIEDAAEVPVMAVIPHDINVLKAQARFIPPPEFKPRSELSDEYKKLAATLVGERFKRFSLKNLFRTAIPKRQDINRELFYDRVFG